MIDDLLLKNFETLARLLLVFGTFFFSILYLTVFRKNQKPTPFYVIGLARTVLFFFSWSVIILSPLGIGLLSPEIAIADFYKIMTIPYFILLGVLLIIASVEAWFYLPSFILKIGGYDIKNPRIRKGLVELKKFLKRK